MKIKYLTTSTKFAVLTTVLAGGVSLRAATPSMPPPLSDSVAGPNQFQTVAMSNFSEAKALTRAYLILATGDHDYKGHRVKAMHQIEAAAKLLGVDLGGGANDRQKQVLSDDKLRDARGLLEIVLNAAEVKAQPRISKHISEAIDQINVALSVH
ncbi:MAG TPA: hypothetical protein VMA35_04130 [Candidatus Sulfopaludibacter sp.]|nr:hypothetical protein [Candidatus Sulfopaludibacter sp.]